MTDEQLIEENRLAKTPPGFGHGKPWKLRAQEIEKPGGSSETLMIPNGMAVNEHLHGFYWRERESYRKLLAKLAKVGATLSMFAIMAPDHRIVGASSLDPSDGPDELAWLSCMIAERGMGRIGFEVPPDIDVSDITPNAKVYGVVAEECKL